MRIDPFYAPSSAVASYGNPANAAHYKSAYWFVVTESPSVNATSAIISRVAYTMSTAFGGLPTLAGVTNFTVNFQDANGSPFTINNGYGDIAFTGTETGGSLYLTTVPLIPSDANTAAFMVVKNVDAAMLSGQPCVATPVRETGLPSLQISFDCTDTVLWATSYNTREWGILSLTDGTYAPVFTGPVLPGYLTGFRDIGGASCTQDSNCPCLSYKWGRVVGLVPRLMAAHILSEGNRIVWHLPKMNSNCVLDANIGVRVRVRVEESEGVGARVGHEPGRLDPRPVQAGRLHRVQAGHRQRRGGGRADPAGLGHGECGRHHCRDVFRKALLGGRHANVLWGAHDKVPGRPAADARAAGKGGARPLLAVKYEEVVLNVRARSSNKPCRVLQMLSGLATHFAISVPEKAMLAFSHRKSNAHPPPVLGDPGLGAVSPGVSISWPESNKRLAQHAWARPAAGGKDGLAHALAGSQVTAPLARQQVHCP